MAVYLKEFENHTQYENYINGSDAILPNVSICTTEGDVYYNPYVEPLETRVVVKYNVTDTSNPTKLCFGFSKVLIRGSVVNIVGLGFFIFGDKVLSKTFLVSILGRISF